MATEARPVPHEQQQPKRLGVRLGAATPARDITVTWGKLAGLTDLTRLSRLGVLQFSLPVSAVDNATGQAVTLAGVDLALLALGALPDSTTTWAASSYANGVAAASLVGSLVVSPPAGALVVPDGGGGLWARVSDTPDVALHFLALVTPF